MKCTQCNIHEGNKESGLCDSCEQDKSRKINGLLYLPAIGIISGIIYGALGLYDIIILFYEYSDLTGFLFYYLIGILAFLVIGFFFSLCAGWFFFRRKKGTRSVIITLYVIWIVAPLYTFLLPTVILDEPLDPDFIGSLVGMVMAVIWILYFLFSKRINIVFCR